MRFGFDPAWPACRVSMTAASPLQERIRNQLRAQFFERIQVGERINEAEVAATLGVSRTPVPHALVQLQARRGRKLRAQPRLSIARSDPAGRSPRWDRFLSTRK
ncbi:GntR family transcriptional regulator [Mesorhizobium sp. M7A.F.Ca.MR.176.00.0.0]|uniref:GntR family transcriptional regulator n=1 Tax=Mesorhizobium sp. TaxID=1871066 RepID=UPI000FD5A762|nr:GntR family transcriptional regulator [Mesorhizobium sp. M7A.F.Ca.MR.176.00.0.0]RWP92458.1 MAG: GntR family transcriptional regulator [Mesorhizobium sp.]